MQNCQKYLIIWMMAVLVVHSLKVKKKEARLSAVSVAQNRFGPNETKTPETGDPRGSARCYSRVEEDVSSSLSIRSSLLIWLSNPHVKTNACDDTFWSCVLSVCSLTAAEPFQDPERGIRNPSASARSSMNFNDVTSEFQPAVRRFAVFPQLWITGGRSDPLCLLSIVKWAADLKADVSPWPSTDHHVFQIHALCEVGHLGRWRSFFSVSL